MAPRPWHSSALPLGTMAAISAVPMGSRTPWIPLQRCFSSVVSKQQLCISTPDHHKSHKYEIQGTRRSWISLRGPGSWHSAGCESRSFSVCPSDRYLVLPRWGSNFDVAVANFSLQFVRQEGRCPASWLCTPRWGRMWVSPALCMASHHLPSRGRFPADARRRSYRPTFSTSVFRLTRHSHETIPAQGARENDSSSRSESTVTRCPTGTKEASFDR